TLGRRGWYRPGPTLVPGLLRAFAATLILSAVVALMLWQLPAIQAWLYGSKALAAAAMVFAAAITYAVAALLTGAVRISDIRQALRR
ncbi:MAG TPA: murein biosynthesis integral membrane protein MurJ, partial [Hyphomonas sp.]|nr:murein biosynthesis integral membrane protein MurJ [Hyphomonas sp.]